MNSYSTKQILTQHKDLIQDIAFDFYGKRVATSSLDQSVKIWNINEKNEWILKEELKINPGLYKVAWAHPEFGSLIAVACDRSVWIYEEQCYGMGKTTACGWIKRMPALADARAPITDLKFAPKYLGLQLVLCTQIGQVITYDCQDISNAHCWTIVQPVGVTEFKTYMTSCSSCSWSTCFNLPILLALGCDDADKAHSNTDKLQLYEYSNNNPYVKVDKMQSIACTEPIRSIAFAPSIGKFYHVLAIASRSALMVSTIKPSKEPHKYSISTVTVDPDVSAWRVCWNTLGSVLAAAGDDRKVRLWKCNYLGSWKCFAEITGDSCCSTLIEQNFNEHELLNRNSDDIEQKAGENPSPNDQKNESNNNKSGSNKLVINRK